MEEPIVFSNKDGDRLFGIVHIPENPFLGGKRVGINLLNPGIKYRVAPHRLNVKLARRLCEKGYYVLRFDPSGIGDSEGDLPEDIMVYDIWRIIQTGLFVPDVIAANDMFINNYNISQLFLIGNCGGAITSLLSSAKDRRVKALCLIDVPINLLASDVSFADTAVQGGEKVDWFFSEYIRRLFRLRSWARFLTFKTNYGALWKTVKVKFQGSFQPAIEHPSKMENLEQLCEGKRLNMFFFKSFETFVERKRPVFFILAGNDPGFEIFQKYFQNIYLKERDQDEGLRELMEISLIENANHIYSLDEWQGFLMSKITNWVDRIRAKSIIKN